ncbi:hypothetical protein DERP_003775 [Dermatophagoides pteronyssinus]|uniref:Uncharacterized protein n=1 Tax=Dermatophagoides pteronyssinus TaxID=6956 RepID=A0ABQ8JLK5_DERPT|nr:hypothetical protein DERP_003775 [Dermatophagoides pteronyssinus]
MTTSIITSTHKYIRLPQPVTVAFRPNSSILSGGKQIGDICGRKSIENNNTCHGHAPNAEFLPPTTFVLVAAVLLSILIEIGFDNPLYCSLVGELVAAVVEVAALPNRKPSAQVPKCLPSVLIHSQTNIQVPCSPIAFEHCFGRIFRQSPNFGK